MQISKKPIADALRELLETFRLPGEAQQIDRITETFSKIYFASEPGSVLCDLDENFCLMET
jgi:brefeldin A-resistance guanine nucleotide exchange factor 1